MVMLIGKGVDYRQPAKQFIPSQRKDMVDFLLRCNNVVRVKADEDKIQITFHPKLSSNETHELSVQPWDWVLYAKDMTLQWKRTDDYINTFYVLEDA